MRRARGVATSDRSRQLAFDFDLLLLESSVPFCHPVFAFGQARSGLQISCLPCPPIGTLQRCKRTIGSYWVITCPGCSGTSLLGTFDSSQKYRLIIQSGLVRLSGFNSSGNDTYNKKIMIDTTKIRFIPG
jgi:hypothetical protein